jgi:hypothetical protein
MRSMTRFAIGMAVTIVSVVGGTAAYSVIERPRVITQETHTKPSPIPKSEFRLAEQEQLRKIFSFKKPYR